MDEIAAETFGYVFSGISLTDTAILALLSGFIVVKTRNLSELMAEKDEIAANKTYSFKAWIKELLMIGTTKVAEGNRVVPPVPPYVWELLLRVMSIAIFLGASGWLVLSSFQKLFTLAFA